MIYMYFKRFFKEKYYKKIDEKYQKKKARELELKHLGISLGRPRSN